MKLLKKSKRSQRIPRKWPTNRRDPPISLQNHSESFQNGQKNPKNPLRIPWKCSKNPRDPKESLEIGQSIAGNPPPPKKKSLEYGQRIPGIPKSHPQSLWMAYQWLESGLRVAWLDASIEQDNEMGHQLTTHLHMTITNLKKKKIKKKKKNIC